MKKTRLSIRDLALFLSATFMFSPVASASEDEVVASVKQWEEALLAGDIDAVMKRVSENFEGGRGEDKAEHRQALSAQSDYQLAWPSAARLARQTGKSRRTTLWHIKAIKQLNIFHVHRFTPQEAVDYVHGKYGFVTKLDRCRHQAPNLFEVNTDHPLWDTSRTIPRENRTRVGSDRPARQFQPQWPPISMNRSYQRNLRVSR